MRITSLCYNQVLQKYLVVMTQSTASQVHNWFDSSEPNSIRTWIAQMYKEHYHPTIIFRRPTDDKVLVVMSTDKNRDGYRCDWII